MAAARAVAVGGFTPPQPGSSASVQATSSVTRVIGGPAPRGGRAMAQRPLQPGERDDRGGRGNQRCPVPLGKALQLRGIARREADDRVVGERHAVAEPDSRPVVDEIPAGGISSTAASRATWGSSGRRRLARPCRAQATATASAISTMAIPMP